MPEKDRMRSIRAGAGAGESGRRTLLPRVALALACACASGACALVPDHASEPAHVQRGPIPTRLQQPVALNFLAFRPRSARIVPRHGDELRVWSHYSSMFEDGFSAEDRVVLDGEIWRTSAAWRRGITDSADLEIELAVQYASSGFLDHFLVEYHELFGLPDGGAAERPQDQYEMDIVSNGQDVYGLEEDEFGLCDVPIVWTQRILAEDEDSPGLAWRVGVELPLGSQSDGLGNGALDFGGGLLAERSWGRWTVTAAADWTSRQRTDAFADADIDVDDLFDLQGGVEYRWNDELSLLCGLIFNSRVTGDIELKEIDREMLELDLGLAWDLAQASRLTLGFAEDLVAESGPDFGFYLGWTLGM
jgi:hypothetical protein